MPNITHLHTACLVGQEESEDEKESFVSVGESCNAMVTAVMISLQSLVLTQPHIVILRPAHPQLRLILNVFIFIFGSLRVKSRDFPGDLNIRYNLSKLGTFYFLRGSTICQTVRNKASTATRHPTMDQSFHGTTWV